MIYIGKMEDYKKVGFGQLKIPRALQSSEASKEGYWEGDLFVYQGLFENDNFVASCKKASECKSPSLASKK
jgi:hypothetical protein